MSDDFKNINNAIRENWAQLAKPGVLTIRPGYKTTGGWITPKPAIVVTVAHKDNQVDPASALPAKVGGVAVDVREADAGLKMRLDNPTGYSALMAAGREEFATPDFPGELDARTGKPLEAAGPEFVEAAKPELHYTAPEGVPLEEVDEVMTITCHASPDAGWPTLKHFLGGVKKSLTVGIYDFTSAHILEAVEKGLASPRNLNLVLDHPAPNPSRDQTDDETMDSLTKALKKHFKSAWALVRQNPAVQEWVYPTAYHIKVAVKDSASFWLSSGNWNNSNQPDIDPIADPQGAKSALSKSDRDWHVVVENKKLAEIFEAYLLNDLKVAAAQASAVGPSSIEAEEVMATDLEAEALSPRRFFPPLVVKDEKIRIQPVLTPDNYAKEILALIRSAKKWFYMQTQYMHPSDKAPDKAFKKLIDAVGARIDAGCDVRLITSQYQLQDGWLEKLRMAGIDTSLVRIQNRVHNKGIVMDSSTVALGSHNWSGDGTLRNRDATLIIHNEEAAQYFERIFLADWTTLARQGSSDQSINVTSAGA